MLRVVLAGALIALFATTGCGEDEYLAEPVHALSVEALMKPETCRECHPKHYEEWSGSMHAYAAVDPVFLAMNARGQNETALGDFCVNCHAPMAVRTGATQGGGLDLANLPSELSGVTCYFCHNVASVDGTHNAQLTLAMDQHMRGGITDPRPNRAHRSSYSQLMDSTKLESASMCGACHDIVTSTDFAPKAVELERTFQEWHTTVFNQPKVGRSCSAAGCHMQTHRKENIANLPNFVERTRHNHEFPGIDVALTDFPQRERQLDAVRYLLDLSVRAEICVARILDGSWVRVRLDNLTGHAFPSGAAQDRRVWVEVVATRGEQTFAAGVVPDGVPATVAEAADPTNFWLLRDVVHDELGHEAHMFWDVAEVAQKATLPPPDKLNPSQALRVKDYRIVDRDGKSFVPERVTLRVRVRPVGLDVIDDLIDAGYDPGVRERMPTFDLLPLRNSEVKPWSEHLTLEWTEELAKDPQLGFETADRIQTIAGGVCVGQSARTAR